MIRGEIVAADVLEVTEGDPAVTIIEAGDLEGLARLIRQGSVYANVHSDDFPAGEVRGQLSPRETLSVRRPKIAAAAPSELGVRRRSAPPLSDGR